MSLSVSAEFNQRNQISMIDLFYCKLKCNFEAQEKKAELLNRKTLKTQRNRHDYILEFTHEYRVLLALLM